MVASFVSHTERLRKWAFYCEEIWVQKNQSEASIPKSQVKRALDSESAVCPICHAATVTTAHIFPEHQGGSYTFWNLLNLCNNCNRGIDVQIIYLAPAIDSKHSWHSLLEQAKFLYHNGKVTISAKLSLISALICLKCFHADGYAKSMRVAVGALRASKYRSELDWCLKALLASIDADPAIFMPTTTMEVSAERVNHLFNTGQYKEISQLYEGLVRNTKDRSDVAFRINLRTDWMYLLSTSIMGAGCDIGQLKAIKEDARFIGDYKTLYQIDRSLALNGIQERWATKSFDLLEEQLDDVLCVVSGRASEPQKARVTLHARAEVLRAAAAIALASNDARRSRYLDNLDDLDGVHALKLWDLPHVKAAIAEKLGNDPRLQSYFDSRPLIE